MYSRIIARNPLIDPTAGKKSHLQRYDASVSEAIRAQLDLIGAEQGGVILPVYRADVLNHAPWLFREDYGTKVGLPVKTTTSTTEGKPIKPTNTLARFFRTATLQEAGFEISDLGTVIAAAFPEISGAKMAADARYFNDAILEGVRLQDSGLVAYTNRDLFDKTLRSGFVVDDANKIRIHYRHFREPKYVPRGP